MVGTAFSLIFLGLVFAVWLMVLASVFLVIAVAGWLFEYETGDFSE
jgi:hypothetical protein